MAQPYYRVRWPLAITGLLLWTCSSLHAYADEHYTITPLAPGLHLIEDGGGNVIADTGKDGIALIDTQFAEGAPQLADTVAQLGNNGAWRYIINTHFHGDHTGGNAFFGQKAPIIAHEAVRQRLNTQGVASVALPSITFAEKLQVYFNDDTLLLQHYPPGHTDSDIIVWFNNSHVVHLGDLFFNKRFPFIDLDGGGDVRGYVANVESILSILPDDIVIVPGHGPKATKADYIAFRNMLVDSVAWAEAQIAAGHDVEAALKEPQPESWQGQSWDFITTERWVSILLRGLAPAPH